MDEPNRFRLPGAGRRGDEGRPRPLPGPAPLAVRPLTDFRFYPHAPTLSAAVDCRKEIPYVACMIQSRITSKAQTTVPQAVRRALGVGPGDEIAWEIEEGRVVLRRARPALDPLDNPFATFAEWSDELDSVYDDL